MTRADIAERNFKSGLNCAQSVLLAFADDLGADVATAEKISRGFGGGMATGDTCGAVSGAIMAIGLYVGDKPDRAIAKKRAHDLVVEFKNRFFEANGSVMCRDLLGYDLNDPEVTGNLPPEKSTKKVCIPFIRLAVEILEDMTNL